MLIPIRSKPKLGHFFSVSLMLMTIVVFSSCRAILPRVADPTDENGQAPTFTLMVNGPGGVMTISSTQACPPDGLANHFDTLFMSLPANRTFRFTYAVTDLGGVSLADFSIDDTTSINFDILTPANVSIFGSTGRPIKNARLVGGSVPMTSLIMTGQLHTQNVSRPQTITMQANDLAGNSVFHNFTIIVAPGFVAEVFSDGRCR